jgi:hypothetical protein
MHYGCCKVCDLMLDAFAVLVVIGWFASICLLFWLVITMLIAFAYECMIRRAVRRLKKDEASE